MAEFDLLRGIITPDRFVDIKSSKAVLVEPDKNAPLSKITLTNLPESCVVIRLDNSDFQKIFRNEIHLNRRSDYLILTTKCEQQYALFVELKTTKSYIDKTVQEIKEKFKDSAILLDLFDIILKHHKKAQFIFQDYQHINYVLYMKLPSDKQTTRPKKYKDYPRDIKFCKVKNESTMDINTLLSQQT